MPTPTEEPVWDPDRYYQPEDLGPICRRCLAQVPKALDMHTHPTCFERDAGLMAIAHGRVVR